MERNEKKMTLIEALKKLNLLNKKMQRNAEDIQRYSSKPSNRKPLFDTEKEQRETIKNLVQSTLDMANEYSVLHARVNRTNMETEVLFQGKKWTIHEMILYNQRLADNIVACYSAMNSHEAEKSMRSYGSSDTTVELLFDEKERANGLSKWMDIKEEINAKLEVVNATTDLVD